MTPKEYAEMRAAEGVGTSAAAAELASLTGANVRTVYRWLESGSEPPAVVHLMDAWQLLPQPHRDSLLLLWEGRSRT